MAILIFPVNKFRGDRKISNGCHLFIFDPIEHPSCKKPPHIPHIIGKYSKTIFPLIMLPWNENLYQPLKNYFCYYISPVCYCKIGQHYINDINVGVTYDPWFGIIRFVRLGHKI